MMKTSFLIFVISLIACFVVDNYAKVYQSILKHHNLKRKNEIHSMCCQFERYCNDGVRAFKLRRTNGPLDGMHRVDSIYKILHAIKHKFKDPYNDEIRSQLKSLYRIPLNEKLYHESNLSILHKHISKDYGKVIERDTPVIVINEIIIYDDEIIDLKINAVNVMRNENVKYFINESEVDLPSIDQHANTIFDLRAEIDNNRRWCQTIFFP